MSKTVIINPLTLRENDIYSFFIFRYHPGNENEGKWLLITLTNAYTHLHLHLELLGECYFGL